MSKHTKSFMSKSIIALAAIAATANLAWAEPKQATPDEALEPGLSLRVYQSEEGFSRVPILVDGQTGNVNKKIDRPWLDNDDWGAKDDFYAEITGFLVIEEAGDYGFDLASDDGSILSIGGEVLISNDGLHGADASIDEFVELQPGMYPIQIRYFEGPSDARLFLKWKTPGAEDFVEMPGDVFRTVADQVRVTSPGNKQFEIPDGPVEDGRRPGDRKPLVTPHQSTDLVELRPSGFEPKVGGIDFLPDGRMIICTWDPRGDVFILDGVNGDDVKAEDVKVHRFATGLAEPLGVKVMGDRIFVLQKQELTELIDTDDDGVADVYRAAVTGWPVSDNFHEFAFGLQEMDGKLIGMLATAINPGGASTNPQVEGRGSVLLMDPDEGTYEIIGGGLRTPNGIGKGIDGQLWISDNQGDWLPSSKLIRVHEGAFYNNHINPKHPLDDGRSVTPPSVWLPQGEIGNSPTNCALIPEGWGPYSGQMVHGDVTHGGVKRVFMEKVGDNQYQGAVFRFGQGMEAGTNRMEFGPDGDLYVGGIGSNGNWQHTTANQWFGLQKLEFNGDVPFEMLKVQPRQSSNREGVLLTFTKPLAEDSGETTESYVLRQWYYQPTKEYGGPKMGEERLSIESATVSDDRTQVWLQLADDSKLSEGHVVYVQLRDRGANAVRGEGDEQAWTTEAWYTMNVLPEGTPDFAPEGTASAGNDADDAASAAANVELEDGFTWLYHEPGDLKEHFRGFRMDYAPGAWKAQNDQVVFKPGTGEGGDLMTKDMYADFDLRLQWKVAPGGNSGVIYRVGEEGEGIGATYSTGMEMQVLDDQRHPDAQYGADRWAGSLYDMVAVPDPSPVHKAGQWNDSRVVVHNGRIEHYLNGEKVVDLDMNSDEWKQRLADSKFADWPRFAKEKQGHIALQDHGDEVAYRNIRIKDLGSEKPSNPAVK